MLKPERAGNWEPLKTPFSLDALAEIWKWPFLATRRKPRMSASVFMGHGPSLQHATVSISVEVASIDKGTICDGLTRFLEAACVRFGADFGFIHVLSEAELERGQLSGAVKSLDRKTNRHDLHVTTHVLRRFLPDLYWLTFLGRRYVEHFGLDRVLCAPAAVVKALDGDGVWLQLTRSLPVTEIECVEFESARKVAKAHLDKNSFFDPELHPAVRDFSGRTPQEAKSKQEAWYSAHRYATPDFSFEPAVVAS